MSRKQWDCVVCGSCTVDIAVRPYDLSQPIGPDVLRMVEPIRAGTGGIVSNSGIALARLGAEVTALSCIGDDAWGDIVERAYQSAGLKTTGLQRLGGQPTSVTIVLVDEAGRRSFAHSRGAPSQMDRAFYERQMPLLAASRCMLLGYYGLMNELQDALPELLAEVRNQGCWTAMDAAGDGGKLQPLDRILPYLDVYVPSRVEASAQTGESAPERMLDVLRRCGAPGLLGIKLGSEGALLSPRANQLLHIPPVAPPAPVRDTTGAGDAFYAGLLRGLLLGWDVQRAGRLAAAAGACCVTETGASCGVRDLPQTMAIAGLEE